MTLAEEVYAQAATLAGTLEEQQTQLLNILCTASVFSLTEQLKDGLTEEDCRENLVAAASLMAVAALEESGSTGGVEEFKAGDLTVMRGSGETASRCLRQQAEMLMGPYLKDCFVFRGV